MAIFTKDLTLEELKSLESLLQNLVDHSYSSIVKNNFIEAFYKFSVDGRLYGQYKLLGAKSGRFTSSNPNMLNMPSTGSIFAKTIKECFVAPKGKIILTADYAALEDRVMASLTKDKNKCDIFLKKLDGHSLNALGYFPLKISKLMEITGDTVIDAKKFKKLVDSNNKEAINIRQESKGPTFGLSYGAYPPKISKTLKISLQEATKIFDNYHNVLYPEITKYRENYILPYTLKVGELHLGLGFTILTDKPKDDIRTLANATCQFWSILTALVINKMHQLIDDNGYQDRIKVISTIYDSIYFELDRDPYLIKWLNDNLIKTMVVDFMENQIVHNEAESEIGYNWSELYTIPNNASIEEIEEVLVKMIPERRK